MVEDDRWVGGRVGRPQRDRASARRPGEIHPQLEAGNRDEFAVLQLAGERQELELHIREADVVAGAQERARLEEVCCAESLASQRPAGGELGSSEHAELRRERMLVVGRILQIDTWVVLEIAADLA